jgi:hypothetical protein
LIFDKRYRTRFGGMKIRNSFNDNLTIADALSAHVTSQFFGSLSCFCCHV